MTDRIIETAADKARHAFYAEHKVEPCRVVAQRIAAKYGCGPNHSMVDEISHALEDAWTLGEKLALVTSASLRGKMSKEQDEPHTPAEALAAAIVDMISAQHAHYTERREVQLDRFDKLVRAIEALKTADYGQK